MLLWVSMDKNHDPKCVVEMQLLVTAWGRGDDGSAEQGWQTTSSHTSISCTWVRSIF